MFQVHYYFPKFRKIHYQCSWPSVKTLSVVAPKIIVNGVGNKLFYKALKALLLFSHLYWDFE